MLPRLGEEGGAGGLRPRERFQFPVSDVIVPGSSRHVSFATETGDLEVFRVKLEANFIDFIFFCGAGMDMGRRRVFKMLVEVYRFVSSKLVESLHILE